MEAMASNYCNPTANYLSWMSPSAKGIFFNSIDPQETLPLGMLERYDPLCDKFASAADVCAP